MNDSNKVSNVMHDDDLQFHDNQSTMVSCFHSTDKLKQSERLLKKSSHRIWNIKTALSRGCKGLWRNLGGQFYKPLYRKIT